MKKIFITMMTLALSLNAFADEGTPTRPAGQGDSSATVSGKVPVPTGKYITGGVLASTVGLGIGHAVEGRYADKGWIFTATEATGIAMMVAGCSERKDRNDDGVKECNNNGLVVAGAVVAIGFHVWEIIDAWSGATPVDDSSPKAFLLPDPSRPTIGVAWSF
jgi:hypothetical protein